MPALLDQARDRVGIGDGAIHNPTRAPVLATRNVVVVDTLPRRDSAQQPPWPPACLAPVQHAVRRV